MKKKLFLILLFLNVLGCNNLKINNHKDLEIIKPNLKSQNELNKDIIDFYKKWEKLYIKKVQNTKQKQLYLDYGIEARKNKEALSEWFIPFNAVTTSESHGYAMVVVASMANIDKENSLKYKEKFNSLYRFFRAHPSKYSKNLMSWQEVGIGLKKENGIVIGEIEKILNTPSGADSAIDGDMDIAYSLLIADKIWGSNGEINYKLEAIKVINAIMENEINKKSYTLLLGDWVRNGASGNRKYLWITRSSDFMLDHIRAFSVIDKKYSNEWKKVLESTEEIINYNVKKFSDNTGLVADFLERDNNKFIPAIGNVLEGKNDGDYNWNACRNPWRFSVDAIYNGSTKINSSIITLNKWIRKKTKNNPENIRPGYYIRNGKTGEIIGDRESWGEDMSFTAPFLVSACIGKENQNWLNKLWEHVVDTPLDEAEYFGNALKMQALIIASGNWISIK
ncbi:glycosyl hydrolase family 8 [Hypnocyclicus thermotrophus]|uniref:Glycosyl hydrolase family 8 n=1 Tax=Hypnocyclicus thermotrophus TaxID=1627895 RepID=A0AA46E004_9FUSO|nr:glycosyl hydrolase family 8 [Hypnocyclicus thermotrophus]TDT72003.1 glycosyl hydrolase family 8 [Hypnocyclicus thermotrophus]